MCLGGVRVCLQKQEEKKKNIKWKGGLAQSLAVSGSPGRGGRAVASEVAYQQCAQARGRVTECVRRSGRGWEASFKARCSSGEGGLFYNHLLFGIFFFFLLFFFFFSRGNNSKKKKKGSRHLIASREREKEVGKGKARRGGRRRDRPLEGRRAAGVAGATRPRGRGTGRWGEAAPLPCPAPALPRRAGKCLVPVPSTPSSSFPRLSTAEEGRERGEVAGFWRLLLSLFQRIR